MAISPHIHRTIRTWLKSEALYKDIHLQIMLLQVQDDTGDFFLEG